MPQYPLRCARRLFNPRAREGRDPDSEEAERYIAEFQPARPRGARQHRGRTTRRDPGFQPARPRGARHRAACLLPHRLGVSTRAPARGATRTTSRRSRPQRLFQPARPRGARPWLSIRSPRRSSFNPRAREGRDEAIDFWERVVEAFQPARPRGARPPKTSLPKSRSGKFQPARPRGARLGELRRRWRVSRGFNPRAREGRDASRLDRTIPNQGFNPRAREGRDRT